MNKTLLTSIPPQCLNAPNLKICFTHDCHALKMWTRMNVDEHCTGIAEVKVRIPFKA